MRAGAKLYVFVDHDNEIDLFGHPKLSLTTCIDIYKTYNCSSYSKRSLRLFEHQKMYLLYIYIYIYIYIYMYVT